MSAIQVKRTPDGQVLARRMDGQPLTAQDREEARRMAAGVQEEGGPGIQEKETIHPSGSILAAPPCQICGATMTETTDIYGRELWVCWECARTA